jgi:hypothetical protein
MDRGVTVVSRRIERSQLRPGDHIYAWRRSAAYIYSHHGKGPIVFISPMHHLINGRSAHLLRGWGEISLVLSWVHECWRCSNFALWRCFAGRFWVRDLIKLVIILFVYSISEWRDTNLFKAGKLLLFISNSINQLGWHFGYMGLYILQ